MLDYYYRFKAPSETTAESLRSFLEGVGEAALELGFEKAVTMDCGFRSVDQLEFARRICLLPSLEDEQLKQADFSSDPSVLVQHRDSGICRIYPSNGVVLVVVDKGGLETTFGFLRFPGQISGIADSGDELLIAHPAGSGWSFEQSVQSQAPQYRRLVKMFEDGGFLESVIDEYRPTEEGDDSAHP